MAPGLQQAAVLEWGEEHRRDLPWRQTRDPWAVLVSEAMLQQTQVARVVPRFARFLDRFPTVGACAAASVADVVDAWAGLGYKRRAVSLHRAAVAVVDRHCGELPRDLAALAALPGVGPYTARAMLAFAFGDDVGVVEVNTARVLARAFAGRRLARPEAQALADDLVPEGDGWAWNQAMIDLGATLCRKSGNEKSGNEKSGSEKSGSEKAGRGDLGRGDVGGVSFGSEGLGSWTACAGCPLRPTCAWAGSGYPRPDPAVGSAGAGGPQSPFAGSDRQGRGRLVDALRRGPVQIGDAAAVAGWPDDQGRARRVAEGLVDDGLAVVLGGVLRLP